MNWLMGQILRKNVKVQGLFIFGDFGHLYSEFAKEMSAWIAADKIKYREAIICGLENAPEAFLGLLNSKNFGKRVIRVGHK
jgi:NADPH-dependent curcumin reductase CurA